MCCAFFYFDFAAHFCYIIACWRRLCVLYFSIQNPLKKEGFMGPAYFPTAEVRNERDTVRLAMVSFR